MNSQEEFKKIPSYPIAYWVSDEFKNIYENKFLKDITISDGQNKTGNNDRFLRFHWEVERNDIGIDHKWLFYAKGGGFRRWYGNLLEVVNWSS